MHWFWKVLIIANLIGLVWNYLTLAAVWGRLQKTAHAGLEVAQALWKAWLVVKLHHDVFVQDGRLQPSGPDAGPTLPPDASVN